MNIKKQQKKYTCASGKWEVEAEKIYSQAEGTALQTLKHREGLLFFREVFFKCELISNSRL